MKETLLRLSVEPIEILAQKMTREYAEYLLQADPTTLIEVNIIGERGVIDQTLSRKERIPLVDTRNIQLIGQIENFLTLQGYLMNYSQHQMATVNAHLLPHQIFHVAEQPYVGTIYPLIPQPESTSV